MKSFLLAVWEVLEVVLIAVVTVFFIRTFLIQPFLVSGASMEPNFKNGNYLLIDEITYRLREPKRCEVIVFKYPRNPSTYYIKRIVGLPGEKIVIKSGSVYISENNGVEVKVLDENYLSSTSRTSGDLSVTLGNEDYLVLGDNRFFSFDSRSWGSLNRKDIIGLVRLRLFPIASARAFSY